MEVYTYTHIQRWTVSGGIIGDLDSLLFPKICTVKKQCLKLLVSLENDFTNKRPEKILQLDFPKHDMPLHGGRKMDNFFFFFFFFSVTYDIISSFIKKWVWHSEKSVVWCYTNVVQVPASLLINCNIWNKLSNVLSLCLLFRKLRIGTYVLSASIVPTSENYPQCQWERRKYG